MRSLSMLLIVFVAVFGFSSNAIADKSAASKPAAAKLKFKLKDSDGKAHTLSQYNDKIVVLEWIEPGCPVCKRHAKETSMNQMIAKYKKSKKVVFLGICTSSRSDAAAVNAFKKKHSLSYPVLMDTTGSVGKMFGAKRTPHMYILENGKVVYSGAMDNDPRGGKEHGERVNYITKAVDQLAAGQKVSTKSTKPYG